MYKESASRKFGNIKVIGASFTNEEYNKLQFKSPQDKDIAWMILKVNNGLFIYLFININVWNYYQRQIIYNILNLTS